MVTFLFSIHTITKAKQYAGLGRAEPGLEQGLWIFQPGHLTWRATVFSWFMWWIKNADQRQASADPETKPLSQSTYACRFIIYIQHRPLITPKADRPTHFIIPQRVKGGVDLSTAVRVCSATPVQGCGSITQWFFFIKKRMKQSPLFGHVSPKKLFDGCQPSKSTFFTFCCSCKCRL